MNDGASEKTDLIRKIINGKIRRKEVKKRLQNMEQKYGKDFFPTYTVVRKEKSWDKSYLKELEMQSIGGASSKEFIMHLSEVSDSLKRRKIFRWAMAGGFIVVIVAAIVWVFILRR